jgi:hypothetical protein
VSLRVVCLVFFGVEGSSDVVKLGVTCREFAELGRPSEVVSM